MGGVVPRGESPDWPISIRWSTASTASTPNRGSPSAPCRARPAARSAPSATPRSRPTGCRRRTPPSFP